MQRSPCVVGPSQSRVCTCAEKGNRDLAKVVLAQLKKELALEVGVGVDWVVWWVGLVVVV